MIGRWWLAFLYNLPLWPQPLTEKFCNMYSMGPLIQWQKLYPMERVKECIEMCKERSAEPKSSSEFAKSFKKISCGQTFFWNILLSFAKIILWPDLISKSCGQIYFWQDLLQCFPKIIVCITHSCHFTICLPWWEYQEQSNLEMNKWCSGNILP